MGLYASNKLMAETILSLKEEKKRKRKTKTPWPIFQPRGGSSEEISVR